MPEIQSILILVNQRAGSNSASDGSQSIQTLFQRHGISATILEVPAGQLTNAATRAVTDKKYDAIVAGGGDGTISAVAAAMVGSDVPFGILPLGTLNHFAKDLSISMTLPEAVQIIATGQTRFVDVAEVNERIFLNNSSIGIYPRIVTHRDRQIERLGRGKWLSLLFSILAVFRRVPTLRVRLVMGGQTHVQTAPFVFVGNNAYHMELLKLGKRSALDRGELWCYFTTRTGRFAVLRLAIRAIFGRLSQAKDFHSFCTTEFWIESARPMLKVAADGEVLELRTPLHYRTRPKSLTVLMPTGAGSSEQ